jgi:hypothetical protein
VRGPVCGALRHVRSVRRHVQPGARRSPGRPGPSA